MLVESIGDVKQVAPELREELCQFLLVLADTKRALGLRYAEWCDRAPTCEAGVAASAMAQDQLGQARVLYALIQEFPGAPADLDDENRPHRYSLAYLDRPFANWATFVAANLLIGAAVTLVEEGLTESRLMPLRARSPKMLEEERFHRVHAEGWFKQLRRMGGAPAANLDRAAAEILPQVLCWFGDAQHTTLADEKIITADPGELRARYLARMGPLLGPGGPVTFHERFGLWSYAGALPWGEFDPVTRRVKEQSSDGRQS